VTVSRDEKVFGRGRLSGKAGPAVLVAQHARPTPHATCGRPGSSPKRAVPNLPALVPQGNARRSRGIGASEAAVRRALQPAGPAGSCRTGSGIIRGQRGDQARHPGLVHTEHPDRPDKLSQCECRRFRDIPMGSNRDQRADSGPRRPGTRNALGSNPTTLPAPCSQGTTMEWFTAKIVLGRCRSWR